MFKIIDKIMPNDLNEGYRGK